MPEPLAEARLGPDHGRYSFRQWNVNSGFRHPIRKTHGQGAQYRRRIGAADRANWNGSGFMRNVVESISVQSV